MRGMIVTALFMSWLGVAWLIDIFAKTFFHIDAWFFGFVIGLIFAIAAIGVWGLYTQQVKEDSYERGRKDAIHNNTQDEIHFTKTL